MFDINSLIGLTEEDANKKATDEKYSTRVLNKDGEELFGTMDFDDKRINLSLQDGKVIAVKVG